MRLQPQFSGMKHYLAASDIIDFGNEGSCGIADLSAEIASSSKDNIGIIKNAFEYVRDNIAHSADINGKIVTCKASEVLRAKEGICYAKAHLLAAILRYNRIPAGFCYQRLNLHDETAPYLVLHGLNAAYINKKGKRIYRLYLQILTKLLYRL